MTRRISARVGKRPGRSPIALLALAARDAFGVFEAGSASATADFSQCLWDNDKVEC